MSYSADIASYSTQTLLRHLIKNCLFDIDTLVRSSRICHTIYVCMRMYISDKTEIRKPACRPLIFMDGFWKLLNYLYVLLLVPTSICMYSNVWNRKCLIPEARMVRTVGMNPGLSSIPIDLRQSLSQKFRLFVFYISACTIYPYLMNNWHTRALQFLLKY